MYAVLVLLLACAIKTLATSEYQPPATDLITHYGIDKHLCYNTKDCHYDEICERVCFWREYTKEFVGCKVACVKKEPEVAEGYRSLLPLEVHKKEPVYKPHPKPAYPAPAPVYHKPAYPAPAPVYHKPAYPAPAPTYHTPSYAPALDEHKQACQYSNECGYGMHCNYAKVCACNKGFVQDPLYSDRCIDLHPKQVAYHPAPTPHYVEPVYEPKPEYTPTCTSKYDCDYGKKCCYWRKCDAYGACTEKRQCAKEC